MPLPHALPSTHAALAPAVIITWATDGNVAPHPGETFGAGSGYFVDRDIVVTAEHNREWIERQLGIRMEDGRVRMANGRLPYSVQIHDPRAGISWEGVSVSPSPVADLLLIVVEPVFIDAEDEEKHKAYQLKFGPPAHRTEPLQLGEEVTLKGFTNIDTRQEYDHRSEPGGHQFIKIAADGQLGIGTISELHPNGNRLQKWPNFDVVGVMTTGQMSGGPVLDKQGRIIGINCLSGDNEDWSSVVDWPTIIRMGDCPIDNEGRCMLHFSGRVHTVTSVANDEKTEA